MKRNYLNWFLTILVVIFSLIIIYMLILKISGHSPTDIVVLYSFIGLIITSQFLLFISFGNLKYEVGKIHGKLDNLTNQFAAMASDFKEHLKKHKK